MLLFYERFIGPAGMDSDCTIGIFVSFAEFVGLDCVFHVTSCDEQVRASNIMGPLDHLISIFEVVMVLPELLVREVGGYVEEGIYFVELFGEKLHCIIMVMPFQ